MNTLEQNTSVTSPGTKITTAWLAALGISTWSDAAAALAFIYTLCLLSEWLWKCFVLSLCEKHGWLKRKQRRASDQMPLKGDYND